MTDASRDQPLRAVQRRERGTMIAPTNLSYTVEGASKERFEAIAKRSGLTAALFFEAVVEHLELTDQGIPPWIPPLSRDGELPIDTA